MPEPSFFSISSAITAGEIADLVNGSLLQSDLSDIVITSVAPIEDAGDGCLSFIDNPKYLPAMQSTTASILLCSKKYSDQAPKGVAVVECQRPYDALALVLSKLYPRAIRPLPIFGETGISKAAHVASSAAIEDGAIVEPGAIVGANASIGAGTLICAGAVVGPSVQIGRNSTLASGSTVIHTLIGDNVIIHNGVSIGQDGFGFSMGPTGHKKMPQLGRVVIQDDVEIGAGTCIDRGTNKDTVIGYGTKIDNLVQIGHNVEVGQHCVIVSQAGIAGSAKLGDFVVLGGRVGIVGHVSIGSGSQIAGGSGVFDDVPAGSKLGGIPARPIRHWLAELASKNAEVRRRSKRKKDSEDE